MTACINKSIVVLLCTVILGAAAGCSGFGVMSRVTEDEKPEAVPVISRQGINYFSAAKLLQETGRDLTLGTVFNLPAERNAAVFIENGKIIDCPDSNVKVNINKEKVYLFDGQQGAFMKDRVIGVILEPPDSRITDAAVIAEGCLDKNQRVLILYLDGLGYEQYIKAKAEGLLPNIAKLPEARKAMTVFPPITPVAYAAMVTGKTPDQTGVKDRSIHNLNCPSVFDAALDKGKQTLIIEGNSQIIDLKGKTLYNADMNQNGLTDDEIQASALQEIREGQYDLMLVHYHSIDDRGHAFGPDASETGEQIKVVDGYVGELLKSWSGELIITADHGMHDAKGEKRLGNHGEIRGEDLFVPLVVREAGR